MVALVALGATGCYLTSAQVLVNYGLPNPFTINGADGFGRISVDLNTVPDDKDNKDKLKAISDFALVGRFTNTNGSGGVVVVYITPGATSLTSPGEIVAGATKLWGPGAIGAAPASRTMTWDDSAALFTAAGKAVLLKEARGDGEFTLYTSGTPGTSNVIRVDKGILIFVIGAGV